MREYTKISVQNPEKTFFTADLHLYHEGIIEHTNRPFKNGQEMNETLIANWNAIVPQDGQVFVLGDMFWKCGPDKASQTMRRLNGRKWLVAGNHDLYTQPQYLEMGFEFARNYLELAIDGRHVILCHYPLLEWNGFYHGSWHLHGHTHGRGNHFSFRVMDVGVDPNNFMPVPWRKVVNFLEGGWELDDEAMRKRGATQRHQPYKF